MLFDTLNWFFKPDSVFATEKIARGDLVDGIPSMIKNSFKRAIFIIPGILLANKLFDSKFTFYESSVAAVLSSIGVSLSLLIYFLMNPDYTTDLCG
jgi:hypothetical protein